MAGSSLTQIEDRIRRTRIESAKMNLRQRRIFEVYLGMGDDRTLEKLYGWCRDEGIKVSYLTLRRWSSEFAWFPLIKQIEENLAEELGKVLLPDHVERVRLDLQHIQRIKLRFYQRVENDEVDITVDEYLKILKVEDMLTSKPLDRPGPDEITGKHKIEIVVTDEQLALALAFSNHQRHGLPPPRVVDTQVVDGNADTHTE